MAQHLFRGAEILDIENGSILWSIDNQLSMDSNKKFSWINPLLIADGSLALQVEQGGIEINLVVSESGKKLLTFCALPEDQWIIYTPEGYWDGSENVHKYVRFYIKDRMLSKNEAEAFHIREKIDAVLASCFGAAKVN